MLCDVRLSIARTWEQGANSKRDLSHQTFDSNRFFNLTDRFQCPGIILGDLLLSEGTGSVEPADLDFDVEIENFLAKRVAIDTQQLGRPDLIASRGGKRQNYQRLLYFS